MSIFNYVILIIYADNNWQIGYIGLNKILKMLLNKQKKLKKYFSANSVNSI